MGVNESGSKFYQEHVWMKFRRAAIQWRLFRVPSCGAVDECNVVQGGTNEMNHTEQHFPVELFVTLYRLFLIILSMLMKSLSAAIF